ncbi:MAG: adenylosuccinate synthase [Rhodobacteraceae bacterium]|nr:adenylosuccinate synthase [Paracoccaceae bacterium]
MTSLTVIGLQWGDEGKGKIVDIAAAEADAIVRFQGGNNAGHTVMHGNAVFKLSQLPSGILRPGKQAIIGNGVVLDPEGLESEIESLRRADVEISPDTLAIASNACLILPLHRELDALRERLSGAARIGTTGKGIGPAYEDKIGRRAIRVGDLDQPDRLTAMVDRLLDHHNCLRTGMNVETVPRDALLATLGRYRSILAPYGAAADERIHAIAAGGGRILLEGAQGSLLDIDHGTYPFVTSSSTVAGSAAAGVGLGPGLLGTVLGVCKAYTTRVGEGPFPTEQDNADGAWLCERGKEFGTVTGRKRRCGWLDLVMLRATCRLSGVDGLALMKLDVLDGLKEIRLCTGYGPGDEEAEVLAIGQRMMAPVEPVYEVLPGWSESTEGARKRSDLPAAARHYLDRIEEITETPIWCLSTSPQRMNLIRCRDEGFFR